MTDTTASPREESGTSPDEDEIAQLVTDLRSLHPRIVWVWIGISLVYGLFFGIAAVGAGFYAEQAVWGLYVGIAVFILYGVGMSVFSYLRFRVWKFQIQKDAIFMRRGVLYRIRTLVPFVRIQHVDTRRGPLERLLGLSNLVVFTAGSRGADITIPGLLHEDAVELQEDLRELVVKDESRWEDAV